MCSNERLDLGYHYPVLTDFDLDGMEDGWEWLHFGNKAQTASGDYDNDGTSNLQEFSNQSEPNNIKFFIDLTNNCFSSSSAVIQLKVTAGVSSGVAILVDSTNFSLATWSNYVSSNITVNLGSVEGWHEVRIGLRGRQTNSVATWEWERLKRDTNSPLHNHIKVRFTWWREVRDKPPAAH